MYSPVVFQVFTGGVHCKRGHLWEPFSVHTLTLPPRKCPPISGDSTPSNGVEFN